MNYDLFYTNTTTKLLDLMFDETKYYGIIYHMLSNQISDELSAFKMYTLLDEKITHVLLCKIVRYVCDNHKSSFNIEMSNTITETNVANMVNTIIYLISCKNFEKIEPLEPLLQIYNILLNDKHKMIEFYFLYLKNIFDTLDIKHNPIEIIIENNNTLIIHEGCHRFIMCYLKKIPICFNVKHSNYKIYDDIMSTLKLDYNNMYKNITDEFVLYNAIPHTLFSNFKSLREDRSEIIINYLKEFDCVNGLEIGAQNGLLTIQLVKQNYNMTCVEYDTNYFNLITNISCLCDVNNKIKIVHKNIYDVNIENFEYDFIVSLSVFYHLKRNNKDVFKTFLINLIKKTKILIFDDEPNTELFTLSDINSLLQDLTNICLHTLFKGNDNRTIYAITHFN